MGKLNEIQEQTTQSYGDNSFTTTIKDDTVEFDSLKDSFTFNDPVEVPGLKINGTEIAAFDTKDKAKLDSLTTTMQVKGRIDDISDLPGDASVGDVYLVGLSGDGNFEEYVCTEVSGSPATPVWENLGHVKAQSDWNQSNNSSDNYIKNKPAIKAGQGEGSIVEGNGTTASGAYSHAEGVGTNVTSAGSHAEGAGSVATGDYSHTEGNGTIANNKCQHVFGEYNGVDPSSTLSSARGTYIEIVGNGTDNTARSNARTLDWSGNETLAGNLIIGGTITANGQEITPPEPQVQADWNQTTSTGSDYIKNKPAIKAGQGAVSIIEGSSSTASGPGSHAEGSGTTASGNNSHAEGAYTAARGNNSHAEGVSTTAKEEGSHAEGDNTTASGQTSHAEGQFTTASGYSAHAEGQQTTASGKNSHAGGTNTTANHKSQHVFGEFNTADPSTNQATARGTYIEIVGNGATTSARSNARTLDWSGNEMLTGTLTIGGASGATLKVESGALKVSFDGGTTWLTVSAS